MRGKEIKETIEVVGKVADNLTESAEERQEALTARHEMDMIQGTWLTKNVRPLTLLALLTYWVIVTPLLEAVGVSIPAGTVNALETLSLAAFTFYFGSKGFEKVQVIKAKADRKERRRNRRAS
jgi:hypothetical protein